MTKNTDPKLKIGFVLDDGLDKPDGVQQYILTLGGWFKKAGHDVRYLVGQSEQNPKDLIELSKNVAVTFNGNKMSIPLWPKLKKIKSTLRQEKFDVIHIQAPFSPVMGGRVLAHTPKNVAVISTFHILPLNDSLIYRLGNKLTAISIRPGLDNIDKFFSVSKPAQEFAEKIYKIDSEVLGNPVIIHPRSTATKNFSKNKKLKIVFLGRLVHRKGCLTLLQAIADLSDHHKQQIEVAVGGTGQNRNELEKFVKSQNLTNVVKFYGFIDEKIKSQFLKSADLAVFPSKGGESFGIVLVEAMAAGGPVVLAGDNPGYRSVMENENTMFDPNDYKALSSKITYFLKNKNALNNIFKSQQKLVKKYDVNEIGKRLLVNYRLIVQNKNK